MTILLAGHSFFSASLYQKVSSHLLCEVWPLSTMKNNLSVPCIFPEVNNFNSLSCGSKSVPPSNFAGNYLPGGFLVFKEHMSFSMRYVRRYWQMEMATEVHDKCYGFFYCSDLVKVCASGWSPRYNMTLTSFQEQCIRNEEELSRISPVHQLSWSV